MKMSTPTLILSTMFVAAVATAQDAAPVKGANDAKDAAVAAPPAMKPEATVNDEAPELRKLAGSYTLLGNQADSAKKVDAAIDEAISGMGAFKKSIARKKIAKVNKPIVRLKLSSVGKQVTVGMDNYVVTAPLDGGTALVKTPSGDDAHASFKLDNASLVQEMVGTNGVRENTFRFNSNGDLIMHVKETSSELTSPISYSLVYKRAGAH